MNKINCKTSTVEKIADDTLYIDIQTKQNLSIDDYFELKQAVLKIGKGATFYHIINMGEFTVMDREARVASCSIEGSYYKKADAYVVHSLSQRLVIRFMLKVNKPVVPTQIFNSVEQAEKWINTIKKSRVIQEEECLQ